jgi:epoxyqueuosine reductase
MDPQSLTVALKTKAGQLGFDLAGAAPAAAPPDIAYLEQWVADGLSGEMRFFAQRLDAYRDPGRILPGVKSILMLGMNYRTTEPAAAGLGQARVSRYAWGSDYHAVIRGRLRQLAAFHRELVPHAQTRGVVDTAPLLERSFARRAGLGWIGKNTLLINERFGSWVFLAALLTTEELQYDEPHSENRCGSCRACLDACPTGALTAPHRLDARRCISHLTVEMRGAIPQDLGRACGNRLFGCDACQEACPWNRQTPISGEKSFQPGPGMNPVELDQLLTLDEAGFRARFCDTPLRRIGLAGLRRNAAVVSENQTLDCQL